MAQSVTRIPPVAAERLTDEQQALVGEWRSMNFASVMVTHPDLYRVVVPLIAKLISNTALPPRDREILVLRTLALSEEIYETQHHVLIAHGAGMTDAEIEQARAGAGSALSPFDLLLVKAAEELTQSRFIRDETWQGLAARYSPIQLMEVVSLVGLYILMAMLTKSLGIQLEDEEVFNNFAKIRQYK